MSVEIGKKENICEATDSVNLQCPWKCFASSKYTETQGIKRAY